MLSLNFFQNPLSPLTILCLGAHSDDIEIGCGGTVIRLLGEHSRVDVHWVVFGAAGEREQEARESARHFLERAERKTVEINGFRDGFLPYLGAEVKAYFEDLKSRVNPDLILTHWREDFHQDHRLVSELTWNTFRNHMILEYEIVKYDGDLGRPNVYFPLNAETTRRKLELLLKCFGSQRSKHWFSEDAFRSILRVRGLESNAPERYAEAFYCRKCVI